MIDLIHISLCVFISAIGVISFAISIFMCIVWYKEYKK